MKKPTDITVTMSADYRQFIEELKARVTAARISAARAVNNDAILLYWDIGRGIVEKQQSLGWGDAVVEIVAADLRRAFPGMRGFSPDSVWRMRQFYSEYADSEFLEQAVPEFRKLNGFLEQSVPETASTGAALCKIEFLSKLVNELLIRIPWGHHVEILKKVKAPVAGTFYSLLAFYNRENILEFSRLEFSLTRLARA